MKPLVLLIGLLSTTPALAQTYVSATLGADLTKSYESTTNGSSTPTAGGEAVAWGLRAGTALGSRWGVELEFNRPAVVDTEFGAIVYATLPAAAPGGFSWSSIVAGSPVTGPFDVSTGIFPARGLQTQQRNTTWNASAWVLQPLGSRADLVILGGLGFSRVEQRTRYSFGGPPERLAGLVIPPVETRVVNYGVGPLVGLETRIRMAEQLTLTPGVRLQTLGNDLAQGWLLRPSLALGWTF